MCTVSKGRLAESKHTNFGSFDSNSHLAHGNSEIRVPDV